ncbi:Uncharacterized protein FWK35_00026199, partial [Aphis craccivora]
VFLSYIMHFRKLVANCLREYVSPPQDIQEGHRLDFVNALDGVYIDLIQCIFYALCGQEVSDQSAVKTVGWWLAHSTTLTNSKLLGGEEDRYPAYRLQAKLVRRNTHQEFSPNPFTLEQFKAEIAGAGRFHLLGRQNKDIDDEFLKIFKLEETSDVCTLGWSLFLNLVGLPMEFVQDHKKMSCISMHFRKLVAHCLNEYVAQEQHTSPQEVLEDHIMGYVNSLDGVYIDLIQCIFYALCGQEASDQSAVKTVGWWLAHPTTLTNTLYGKKYRLKLLGGEEDRYPAYRLQAKWVRRNTHQEFSPNPFTLEQFKAEIAGAGRVHLLGRQNKDMDDESLKIFKLEETSDYHLHNISDYRQFLKNDHIICKLLDYIESKKIPLRDVYMRKNIVIQSTANDFVFRSDFVYVGKDDSRSKCVITTKAEIAEAGRVHLLGRQNKDIETHVDLFYKRRINERAERWKSYPLVTKFYLFDTRVPFPFGRGYRCFPEADIVFRPVPIYSNSVLPQISQAVSSGAAKRQTSTMDIGAGVLKAPIVRQLFVDAVTGQPIADPAPETPTVDHCPPTVPLPSTTSNLQFGFNDLKIRSSTKIKYLSEEEKVKVDYAYWGYHYKKNAPRAIPPWWCGK